MQFKEGDPVILTNLKYAGRDSDDIADVVIFPTGTKIALFEPLFGPSSLVSASALDEIERLREQAHYHYENGLKKDVEIERLREALRLMPKTIVEAADEIERLREELEDMHRRERSTAIQQLGNEGQWCDLVAAKDDEIERLRGALRKVAYSRPAGPLRNKLAERYEKVACAALAGEKTND